MRERLQQVELVGQGAMSEVHRGLLLGERGVSKPVAIKRLRHEVQQDPEAVELFVNEAKITMRLNHPNVVSGLEFSRDDLGYYLVCEWLDCVTLAAAHERLGPLPWPAVAAVGEALAGALGYLHGGDAEGGAHIVHRDVTPANVLLTSSGGVKLGDFGVATCRDIAATVQVREVGTPGFAAPEQARGEGDERSDVYGWGATLEAVAGELPEPLAAVLARAHQASPGERYASAQELRHAVAAAAAACPPPAGAQVGQAAVSELVKKVLAPASPTFELDGAVQSILGGALGSGAPADPPVMLRAAPARRSSAPWIAAAAAAAVVVLAVAASQMTAARPPAGAPKAPEAATGEPNASFAEVPAPSPEAPRAALPEAPPTAAPGAKPVEVATRPPAPPRRPPEPRATSPVSINSVPWAEVRIDGRPLGNTPLREVALEVGRHEIQLAHPSDGTQRSFTIEVQPGHLHTFVVDLRRGTIDGRRVKQ